MVDLQESLERYRNILPVFGFNSAQFDLNLIKSYLLPILVNERDIEATVIKKANKFISFEFGDNQLLEKMLLFGGPTNLVSFLEAYKTSETKRFVPHEGIDQPGQMQNTKTIPYDAFSSKVRSCNPLKMEHNDNVNLLKSGITTKQAVAKSKLSKPLLTVIGYYQYLQLWVVFIYFVPVTKFDRLSLKKINHLVVRRGSSIK